MPGAIDSGQVEQLKNGLSTLDPAAPGTRLTGNMIVQEIAGPESALMRLAREALGAGALPVRAIWFDKSDQADWALGWHQDRTVAVKAKSEREGWGPWTLKSGIQHVEPPFSVIEAMVTLRLHADPVPEDNAPLMIVPGSHRLGRIPEPAITDTVNRLGVETCLADAGDVWVYSTPILHASDRARAGRRRRVLQIDYSAAVLPEGLEWQGI